MSKPIVKQINLGRVGFGDAWDFQNKLFDEIIDQKKSADTSGNTSPLNYLIFCEHNPVFTLGKNASKQNVLVSEEDLEAEFYKIDRGGDITYHGPGQVVGYPILDLEQFEMGLKDYIFNIEDTIISLLKSYNISSNRLTGANGVWIDADNPFKSRKICAIGVRSSRFVTMHGFAFNVNTQLSYFEKIIPCGIQGKQVSSLEKELDYKVPMEQVINRLSKCFQEIFKCELSSINHQVGKDTKAT